ncbi:hypothetical protein FRC01_004284 [Tulasnella sp. 417]|nr:hypothetical protein FRC01_004284 [Tulasnella sp. 417]
MLGKLFRRRQATTSPSSSFEPGPTASQPTDPKTPSKLVRGLKKIKKALRPNRLSRKVIGTFLTVPTKGSDTDGIDPFRVLTTQQVIRFRKTMKLAPQMSHLAADDHQRQGFFPIPTHNNTSPSATSINGSPTAAPPFSARNTAPRSHFPINPSSAPRPTTRGSLANQPPRVPHPFHTSRAGLETLRPRMAKLKAMEKEIWCGQGPKREAIRPAGQAQVRVPPITRIAERYAPQVSTTYDAGKHIAQEVRAPPKPEKERQEEREKRSEIGKNPRNTKGHLRTGAVDYGNPVARLRDLEQLVNQTYELERSHRSQPPRRYLVSEHPHRWSDDTENQPMSSQDNVGGTRSPTTRGPSNHHGRNRGPRLTGTAEAAGQTAQWLNNNRTSTQSSVAHPPLSTAQPPIAVLQVNFGPSRGAQSSPPASISQYSEDAEGSSNDDGAQGSTLNPYLWLGQIVFDGPPENEGPAQH